jgi:hypothetical protein
VKVAHPIRTESAPSGVTRIAGANAYAAKLKISPITTAPCQQHAVSSSCDYRLVVMPAHQVGFWRYLKPSPSKPCFSAEAFKPCAVECQDAVCAKGGSMRESRERIRAAGVEDGPFS